MQTASENLAVLLFAHNRGTVNGVITYYPARGYNKQIDGVEVSIQKQYTFGSQTIAIRVNGALNWVLGDHLGSTSVTANADGSFKSQIQYTAFGEIRASLGINESEYRYTGQLRQAELGLYYYVARWYDPYLNHFTSADSIVPGGVQGLDRYAYVLNNPLKYIDPSGHTNLCAGYWDSGCTIGMPGQPATLTDANLLIYGITVASNNMSISEKKDVLKAAELSGKKWQLAGKGNSPEEAFKAMHGPIKIVIDPKNTELRGNCEFEQGTLTCKKAPTIPNTIHEFGHAFDVHFGGGPADQIPLGERSTDGLACAQQGKTCVENTFTLGQNSREARYEELADFYLNWVLDGNPDYPNHGLTTDQTKMYDPYTRPTWWDWFIISQYP